MRAQASPQLALPAFNVQHVVVDGVDLLDQSLGVIARGRAHERRQPVPTQGHFTPDTSNAVATWKTQIVALLERNKRYPESAQARREQGVVQVLFSLDRNGRVIVSRVLRSSGSSLLDEEALALLLRAEPFSAPPPEAPGERVNLTVPIRFNLAK